jgi:hypothetical protein
MMSRHQTNIIYKINEKPVKKQLKPPVYWCIYIAKPNTILKAPIAHINAQGDGSTKWNGCF